MQKLDGFFATTRKFVMGQYGIGSSKAPANRNELDPEAKLHTFTKHPMTYFRALESDKSKFEFLQMI